MHTFSGCKALTTLTGGIFTKLSGCCSLTTDITLLLNFSLLQVISSSVTSWQFQALLGRRRVTVKMNSLLVWCIRLVGFSLLYSWPKIRAAYYCLRRLCPVAEETCIQNW